MSSRTFALVLLSATITLTSGEGSYFRGGFAESLRKGGWTHGGDHGGIDGQHGNGWGNGGKNETEGGGWDGGDESDQSGWSGGQGGGWGGDEAEGGRGWGNDDGFGCGMHDDFFGINFTTLDCSSAATSAPNCSYRGDDDGMFVCRTLFNRVTGEKENFTACINPEKALPLDECGCCGACPEPCPCSCETWDGSEGVQVERAGKNESNYDFSLCLPSAKANSMIAKGLFQCSSNCTWKAPEDDPTATTAPDSTVAGTVASTSPPVGTIVGTVSSTSPPEVTDTITAVTTVNPVATAATTIASTTTPAATQAGSLSNTAVPSASP